MRSIGSRTGVAFVLLLLGGVAGCADEGNHRHEREGAVGTSSMSFEEFEARTYREPGTGMYIVAGDTPIPSREALRAFFDRYMQQGALTLHLDGGVEAKWDDTQKLQLTYCVSTRFGARYADVVAAMQAAVDDWEAAANINFIHLSSEDASCDAANPNVLFDVNLAPPGEPYLARAFFPGFPREFRNILVAEESFGSIEPYTLAGVMKHEVGHVLGFRHEHVRAEAAFCYEDDSWKPLTGYDSASVMHYPFCDGTNTGDLALTPIDRDGAASIYGGHPICITVQRGVSGGAEDATLDSTLPRKNFNDQEFEAGERWGERLGLLRFDLSGVPAAARVQSATVTLYERTRGGVSAVNVHRATAPWSETSVTYNSFAGAYAPEVAATFSTNPGGEPGFVSFDATALAKAWVKGPNHGLVLDAQGDRTRFRSSEAARVEKHPRLELCYLPPASPPPSWTCAADRYGTGDGCDCACGFADLDCFQPDQPVIGCGAGESCSSQGTCKLVPAEWTCSPDAYAAGSACDCNCGAPDPDCDAPFAFVRGCPDWTYTCDAAGQCRAPFCGDGVVTGVEACDPPDGVTCDANCQILYPPESSCNDLYDDDFDDRYDCQDPDCQALGVCSPGGTPTGGACTAATDCSANANDPFCVSEPLFGWLAGYCSEYCDTSVNDCAGDAICLPVESTTGFCVDGCAANDDCRAGYSCQDLGLGNPVCWPAQEVCDNGADDDGDGAADCADDGCASGAACAVCGDGVVTGNESCDPPDGVTCSVDCQIIYGPESSCDDLNDNDADGLYDCQDPDCQALGGCTPGGTPTGGTCTAATDCSANASDPFCISEPLFGWSAGYCSEYCDASADDCAGDAVCIPVGGTSSLCFDGCVTNDDCRAGYVCRDFGVGVACAPL